MKRFVWSHLVATVQLILVAGTIMFSVSCAQAGEQYALRGYRQFSHAATTQGADSKAVTIHTFTFKDPARAVIFASKIYSDYELTFGNKLEVWEGPKGALDVIVLGPDGYLVPVLGTDGKVVTVLIGTDKRLLLEHVRTLGNPRRRKDLSHPLFMDKWDRYCFGTWQSAGDFANDPDNSYQTPAAFYQWMGKTGINAQLNITRCFDGVVNDNKLTWLRMYFQRYGVKFQNVEWLGCDYDLYNRNPFLSSFPGSGLMQQGIYYGEAPHAPGLLSDVRNANAINLLQRFDGDDRHLAILDPDGEVEVQAMFAAWSEYGPVQRRNFVRYLRDFRKLKLTEVSQRYTGKANSFRSWDDVTLADWRTFYGWTTTPAAQDLAGEWRVMRDDRGEGLRQRWESPAYDDSDWIRLYYPGDQTMQTLFGSGNSVWMRRTFKVQPTLKGQPIYLTIAPLCGQSVQVYLNGRLRTTLTPRFHTARVFGQLDISDEAAAAAPMTLVLRMSGGECPVGPVFVTSKKLQDFPTDDPCLNARRYDHLDFVDWAVADSAKSTLYQVRAVDPDRPVKVHAYEHSSYGWQMIKEIGGYSHHTGSGAGWNWMEPKQYGSSRNLQDSSETGGPMDNIRDIKGLMGNLAFMGKNAHDYFYNIHSITHQPGMRKWLEDRLPAIRIMGRSSVRISPLASFRGLRNVNFLGEFGKEEEWRHGYELNRGGEVTTLLDELRIKEGALPYRAVFDEGNLCWDGESATALGKYVAEGGILFLQAGSGRHSDSTRDVRAGAQLAGVTITGERPEDDIKIDSKSDPLFAAVSGKSERTTSHTMTQCLSLAVLEGTEVVGTFKDGSPAVTRRSLGKGTVYYCAAGIWPGFLRTAVVERLGSEVYAKANRDGVDLLRTAQSNNGCEELLMLRGLGKKSTVEWTLDFPPARLYNPVTGAVVEAKINSNVVTFDVNIPDWDFAWYAVRRPNPVVGGGPFAHWLERQSQMWSGLVAGTPGKPVEPFRHVDLNHDWLLVQTKTAEEASRLATLDDNAAGLKSCPLVFWDTPGLDLKPDLKVGLYRRYFDLPKAWQEADSYDLRVDGRFPETTLHGFSGTARIMMNGVEVWSGKRMDATSIKIPVPLKLTGNKLEIIHEGNGGMKGAGGIMADLALVRSLPPDQTISLLGKWRAVDGLQAERAFSIPGKIDTSFIYRDVEIPADLATREIWLVVDTESAASAHFTIVNGRKRYDILGYRDETRPLEINITPDIRFGASNRIVIGSTAMSGGWKKSVHTFKGAEIRCYEPGRWSPDGQGIRNALSPRELEAARLSQAGVTVYPLVQTPVAKTPISLGNFTPAELAAYTPPPALLELKLDDAKITDLSQNQIPVKVHGTCTPFAERGGKIKGIYIRDTAGTPGWLEIPNAPLQNLIAGKSFTICAWIKPLLMDRDAGTLLRLGNSLSWELGQTNTTVLLNSQWGDRFIADGTIAPRAWQFVTLTLEGNRIRMWIDGIEVGSKQGLGAMEAWNSPGIIGSAFGSSDFCNFKLATLAFYHGALPETDVRKLFLQNRDRFTTSPGEVWPTDDLVGLAVHNGKLVDYAEFPSTVETGGSVRVLTQEGHPVLHLDGGDSYLFFKENPKVHILGQPFSMVMDIKPEEKAAGCLFRRYHDLCLYLEQDGTLRFDANIAQNNMVVFDKALQMGHWNRLMLTYDGRVVSLFLGGKLLLRKDYAGHLSDNRWMMLCLGADNTYALKNGKMDMQLPMALREFRIIPGILETMPEPPATGGLDSVK